MPIEVFLDTTYAIALASVSDQYHPQAIALAEALTADEHFRQAGFQVLLKAPG